MTARNMQEAVKKKGLPWSAAKGFDTFNPVSSFIDKSKIKDPSNVRLWLKTNDTVRQDGNTKDMIFDIPHLIQHVSSIMTLEVGDLLLTGACLHPPSALVIPPLLTSSAFPCRNTKGRRISKGGRRDARWTRSTWDRAAGRAANEGQEPRGWL